MKALLTRRSIRRYTEERVPDPVIKELLEAAMCAPSAGDEQPWEFIVIDDKKVLEAVSEKHPHAKMAKDAPLAVLVCGDPTREIHKGFWVQDCAAAVENLLIAVNDKGLGAVWCGVYPREERMEEFRALAHLPKHIVPFALIPIGHPAEHKLPPQRFDPKRIHHNRW